MFLRRLSRPFLKNLYYDVEPADPPTFFIVTLLLGGLALAACAMAARRATTVEPSIGLRRD
ncbi:MAG: hypothetical protein ACRD8O_12505 [Bryobacteraceae bacterium]